MRTKRNIMRGLIALIIATLALAFTACKDPTGGGTGTAPTITTASLPNGAVGTAYSQTLAATGDAPITWSLESGALPAGLSLSGNTIAGNPTAAGTSTFTVKATNATGSDNKQLSITIATVGGAVPPAITTASLSNGMVEMAYSETLAATGDAPITWSIESGTLPTGLTISTAGVISGTPTTANIFTFTVKATNATGSDTKELSISIAPILPGITISVKQIEDEASVFPDITISRTGSNNIPVTKLVEVENASDYSGIEWEVAGVGVGQTVTGSEASFTLDAQNVNYNSLGGHALILVVTKGEGADAVQYIRAIPFTVVQ